MPVRCCFWWALVISLRLNPADTITPPDKCYPIADVVFLIDGSDSISDEEFQDQKTFVRRFVEMSDIGAERIHVGYAVVSSRIGDTMNLTSGAAKADILAKVDKITQPQEGSRTDTGIIYIDNMFFTLGRLGTMYIGVVLTDGRAKYQRATKGEATVAKNSGVFLIAIGVGRHIRDEMLTSIASTPSNSYHMKPMNYSLTLLTETVKYLGKEWCSDIVTGLPPIKQNSIYLRPDTGLSSKNISAAVSYISSANNTNGNISDSTIEYTTKPWKSFYLGRISGNYSNGKQQIQPPVPLPQTTVYPVTRNNIGKILQALISSKRAKSQGIAFVKSRKDLKDALRILLAARAIGINKMYPRTESPVRTNNEHNKTYILTTMPLLHVLSTTRPTFNSLTPKPYIPAKETVKTNASSPEYKDLLTSGLVSTPAMIISQMAKANNPNIFKSRQTEQRKQDRSKGKHLKDKSEILPTFKKASGFSLPKQKIRPDAIKVVAVDKKQTIANYSLIKTRPKSKAMSPSNVIEPDPKVTKIKKTPPALARLLRARALLRDRLKSFGRKHPVSVITSQKQSDVKQKDSQAIGRKTVIKNSSIASSNKTKAPKFKHIIDEGTKNTSERKIKAVPPQIAFRKGMSNVQPLHMVNEPMRKKQTTSKGTVEKRKVQQQPSRTLSKKDITKTSTKTVFSAAGFNEQSGQTTSQQQPSQTLSKKDITKTNTKTVFSAAGFNEQSGQTTSQQQPSQTLSKKDITKTNTKTVFSAAGFTEQSGQTTSQTTSFRGLTTMQQPAGRVRQLPLSPVSMFSDTGRMSFSLFQGIQQPTVKPRVVKKTFSEIKHSQAPVREFAKESTTKPIVQIIDKGVPVASTTTGKPRLRSVPTLNRHQHTFQPVSDVNRVLLGAPPRRTFFNTAMTSSPALRLHQSRLFEPRKDNLLSKSNLHAVRPQLNIESISAVSPQSQTLLDPPLKDSQSSDNGHNPNPGVPISNGVTNHMSQINTEQITVQHPQHNHTLDKSVALELCTKSRFVDGVGYAYKPNSCIDFLQCIHVNGHIKVEVGHCPIGTYFDEKTVICRQYNSQYCRRDPCYGHRVQTYGHPSNCRGFWRCEAGRSQPGCCPKGFAYARDGSCVMNPKCTVPCLEETPKCNSTSFKTNDRYYFEKYPGLGWMIRTCPQGSRYVSRLCGCQPLVEKETRECSPQISIDFEDSHFDSNKALYNRNVKIEGGVGKFGGRAMITLWRFTGISFGTSVLITMKFKIPNLESHKGKLMHLLSNCCIGCPGRPGPTIDIAVLTDSTGGVVVLSTYSSASGEKFVFIPYLNTRSGWNSLTYSYDGKWLVGTINDVTVRQQMKGTIESRPYPLLLGSCGTVPSFQGYIDDVRFLWF